MAKEATKEPAPRQAETPPPAQVSTAPPAAAPTTDTTVNPAAAAASDAARTAELDALRRERDELREALRGAPADDLTLLRAETDALRVAVARAGGGLVRFNLSEGMRHDLETRGHAVDPNTGATLVLDRESKRVIRTTRRGEVATFEMPEAPVIPGVTE
jgi:hypothetical protein